MQCMRRLALFVVAIAATMGMAATTASAQIEVLDEGTGLHCGLASECVVDVHTDTVATLTAHLMSGVEVVTTQCNVEISARVGEDGEGEVFNQVMSGTNCPSKPCEAASQGSGDGDPWPIHLRTAPGDLNLHFVFCIEPSSGGGPQRDCELLLDVTDNGSHAYEVGANDAPCGGPPTPPGVRSIEADGHGHFEETSLEVIVEE
jgi:hypothetical protein